MVTLPPFPNHNLSNRQDALRALLSLNPGLSSTVEFLFPGAAESLSFHGLHLQPAVATHRNPFGAEPLFLPTERFGGAQDVPMIPLLRGVVDEAIRAYANTSPYLLEYVGKTPIAPYGSLGLSVSRWGYVDWDYIRDLDWRIYLPPGIGHTSGFKSELNQILTQALHNYGFYPLLGGKDVFGQPQVQLRDQHTSHVHGFHFYLAAMNPGFVRGNIHLNGGYSPHYAYFPENSLEEYLQSANLLWSDVITQLRDDYIQMFNQLSYNIFAENSGEDRLYKTRGWYLHKAFKWYATLARARGLSSLEEDLLYEYEHFQGSEAELSYLARYRYYARLTPLETRLDDVDRDLARAASIEYARARYPRDPLIGKQISLDGAEIILLEAAPEELAIPARRLLEQAASSCPDPLRCGSILAHIRFADNLAAPSIALIDRFGQATLIPGEWSMVFSESYLHQAGRQAAAEDRTITAQELRQALVVLLAFLLGTASPLFDASEVPR